MAISERPPANGFVAFARKVYNPVGFAKGYNFILWFIFSGALFGFTLARLPYMSFYGVFCNPDSSFDGAAPGECYYYLRERVYTIGIQMHLVTIIPASFLAVFQFLPVLRHKVILFHRINGYAVILLSLVATAGAIMIAPVSFGGDIAVQSGVGALSIMFIVSLLLAFYNIKRLQLEQHRAWMLRAWFYVLGAMIISAGVFHTMFQVQHCPKVQSFFDDDVEFLETFPLCNDMNESVAIKADFDGRAWNVAAALNLMFGPSLWMASVLHGIGIEVYLRLTPAEFERLREISHKRQLERGFKHPGRAGLTIDRLGDSELWAPEEEKTHSTAALIGSHSPDGPKPEVTGVYSTVRPGSHQTLTPSP